ncbi:sensor histidine kinase [Taibaiella koreensis]|uniref:sensor histidine kinase n=1 Tax=Taibaiella koreensis TaxID=1268548 RepID=UPI000E59C21C|nr:histidine kinase [Taibaiella koreensis]
MKINARHINWKIAGVHLAFWSCYVTMNHFINMVQNPGIEMFFIDSIGKYFVAAFVFYITAYFILPTFWRTKKYFFAGLCIALMCPLSFLLKKILYFKLFIHFGYPELPYTNAQFFFLNIWWWTQYTLFAFGFWFAKESLRKEKKLRIKEQQQLVIEKERLALEIAKLKAQINPHFLFNTLGFFHNRMLTKDPPLADGLISLTEIMRSSIRQADNDGLVPLAEEATNIENLISIYKLRYDRTVFISFENVIQDSQLKILPHILITLVENALKHGELHNPGSPLLITLKLQDGNMMFTTRNRKKIGPKERSFGIGTKYIISQLKEMYQERYKLEVNDDADTYKVMLSIEIQALTEAS